MWTITFTKEVEVEANTREEAINEAFNELYEDFTDILENSLTPEKEVSKIFDIESERVGHNTKDIRRTI
jgi:SHS2 domain-containing protein